MTNVETIKNLCIPFLYFCVFMLFSYIVNSMLTFWITIFFTIIIVGLVFNLDNYKYKIDKLYGNEYVQ